MIRGTLTLDRQMVELRNIEEGAERNFLACGKTYFSFIFVHTVYTHTQQTKKEMDVTNISKPSKQEQRVAMQSHGALSAARDKLRTDTPEIEIEETQDKIRVPLSALRLLAKILEVTSQGKPISIVPIATEMTTQAAADIIGCSRPHLVKLLEEGQIPFTKIGKHRRVKFEDVVKYKKQTKAEREALLIQMMQADEESGLYDT